ncbi:hypothetical protein E2C01_052917 [Portunus trituberculatus]|uniref:Uncharacterized protein n=1 Tax=Portunus trituberculatus TaxID=210409 RepID=A0A5B7GN32_PORTR|nr:hypothetical protein [Portunus trituberculatus]
MSARQQGVAAVREQGVADDRNSVVQRPSAVSRVSRVSNTELVQCSVFGRGKMSRRARRRAEREGRTARQDAAERRARAAAEHVFSPLGSRLMSEEADERRRNESSGASGGSAVPVGRRWVVFGGLARCWEVLRNAKEC